MYICNAWTGIIAYDLAYLNVRYFMQILDIKYNIYKTDNAVSIMTIRGSEKIDEKLSCLISTNC